MVEYPLHMSFLLARAFPTDMLLSRQGLRLTPSGKHATATAALSIRQAPLNITDLESPQPPRAFTIKALSGVCL